MVRTAIKERPILFSGPMVRALLDGRKTQTRRKMKQQPYTLRTEGFGYPTRQGGFVSLASEHCLADCPYGVPGDRLVASCETLHERDLPVHLRRKSAHSLGFGKGAIQHSQRSTYFGCESIVDPETGAEVKLEVTEVRVQRLQEISEADAIAEGVEKFPGAFNITPWRNYQVKQPAGYKNFSTPLRSYCSLWESINGPGSWAQNPWIWAVSFKAVTA